MQWRYFAAKENIASSDYEEKKYLTDKKCACVCFRESEWETWEVTKGLQEKSYFPSYALTNCSAQSFDKKMKT